MEDPGSSVVVSLQETADLRSARSVSEALDAATATAADTLIVDLENVTFIDSMILGVLLKTSRRLQAGGGELRIVVDDPNVRRLFEVTLLDRIFRVFPTLELAQQGDEQPRRRQQARGRQTSTTFP